MTIPMKLAPTGLTTAAAATPAVHIPVLDGVRGLAVLAVVLFHFTGPIRPTRFVDFVFFRPLQCGWVGVDLFFVLSGFLITGILYDSKGSKSYFSNFYIRRALRIFPLYFAFLFVIFVLLAHVRPFHDPGMMQSQRDQIWLWTYCTNIAIAVHGPGTFGPVGHLWSLAVEEQFYLIWPLMIYLSTRRAAQTISVACIALAAGLRFLLLAKGVNFAAIYTLTPCRFDSLAVGAWIALAQRGPGGLAALVPWARRIFAATGLALVAFLLWRGVFELMDPLLQGAGYSVIAVFFGSGLVLAMTADPSSRAVSWLSSPVMRVFGKYSYAIYLLHVPLNPALYLAFSFNRFHLHERSPVMLLAFLPYLVLGTASYLLLGHLSWRLFESRFLQLKRFFY